MKTKTLFQVPFTSLAIAPGLNIRSEKSYGNIEKLASQILENGIAPMEVIKKDSFFVVKDGHRRHAAVTLLITNGTVNSIDILVDCYIEPDGTTDQQRVLDMLMHAENEPITPFDEAHAYGRLIKKGYTNVIIAKAIGRSSSYVSTRLLLNEITEDIQQAVVNGQLSITAATKLARYHPKEQQKIIKGLSENKKIKVKEVQKKQGMLVSISGKYVNDLYSLIDKELNKAGDSPHNMQLLWGVKVGIELCKNNNLSFDEKIQDLLEMF